MILQQFFKLSCLGDKCQQDDETMRDLDKKRSTISCHKCLFFRFEPGYFSNWERFLANVKCFLKDSDSSKTNVFKQIGLLCLCILMCDYMIVWFVLVFFTKFNHCFSKESFILSQNSFIQLVPSSYITLFLLQGMCPN